MATKLAAKNKILVYGIGNPGRQDDGLGPALVAELEKKNLAGLTLEANYQLQVEDALLFAEHQMVIVVDALGKGDKPYIFKKVKPAKNFSFTTHSFPPEGVAYLCQALYQKKPEIYLLAIRGYYFDLGETISLKAQENLREALRFFMKILNFVTPKGKIICYNKCSESKKLLNLKEERKSNGKKQKRSSRPGGYPRV
ncbi:MAG: hydrogenase maturation protease [Candidatus Aminicenantes bacterium]|nr:MAG: hydrogenase maturation protease [Candidatus Aminicenantes bacterium]